MVQTTALPAAEPIPMDSAYQTSGWLEGASIPTYVSQLNDVLRAVATSERATLLDAESIFLGRSTWSSHEDNMHLNPEAQLALLNVLLGKIATGGRTHDLA